MSLILDLSRQYSASGSMKIAALITGGGFSFLEPCIYPGCSRWLHSVIIPYDRDSWGDYGWQGTAEIAKVDRVTTEELLTDLKRRTGSHLTQLVINAALTTDRARQGENRAWIGLQRPGQSPEFKEMKFTKLEPWSIETVDTKRSDEDRAIGIAIWTMLNGERDA